MESLGGAIFGLLGLCVVAGFAFVQQAGGLSQLVEHRLNKISDRLVVAVSDARLGADILRPLTLNIDHIHRAGPEQDFGTNSGSNLALPA